MNRPLYGVLNHTSPSIFKFSQVYLKLEKNLLKFPQKTQYLQFLSTKNITCSNPKFGNPKSLHISVFCINVGK